MSQERECLCDFVSKLEKPKWGMPGFSRQNFRAPVAVRQLAATKQLVFDFSGVENTPNSETPCRFFEA